MPTIKNICSVAGCKNTQPCSVHSKDLRKTAHERGYDHTWQRCQASYLVVHPLCECGCGKPAEMVHHIHPLKYYPNIRLEWMNLLSLTNKCHAELEEDIEEGKELKLQACMDCDFRQVGGCAYGIEVL